MTMTRKELIFAFSQLGKLLEQVGLNQNYSDNNCGLNATEYEQFLGVVESARHHNQWFTPENVRMAFRGIASWLNEEKLEYWLKDTPFSQKPKRVGIIMAGNIPLVGFHDFLAVVMTGNIAICKLSSDDTYLWKALFSIFSTIEPNIQEYYEVSVGKLGEIDAIIATGSDNSSRYFEYYFGKHPHIIRKNRTSVAILNGSESLEDIHKLADDIFSFYGLGCRNISQLFVPESFEINRFFEGLMEYKEIINHNKYANNFDYQRAISLLNKEDVLENGFVLLKFSDALFSPLSIINCYRYSNELEVSEYLENNKDKIQVVVGKDYLPFGTSQQPDLDDYADGVNTLDFLVKI